MRIRLSLTPVLAGALLTALLALPAAAGAHASPAIVFCKGSQLSGRFAAVPGSAGAGNITYRLTLRNSSSDSCSLTGLPSVQLLGKTGAKLPTKVHAAFPGALTAILVTLAPGRSSKATARLSPDVPGTGEQTTGRCEPVAYTLRVTARGGGVTDAKIAPPTSVCEHGTLQFSAYLM